MQFQELISVLPHSHSDLDLWEMKMSAYFGVSADMFSEAICQHSPGKKMGDFFRGLQNGTITEENLATGVNSKLAFINHDKFLPKTTPI